MSMSTPPRATTATTSTAVHHHTYWCHECDMSVLIHSHSSSTSSPPLCPNCRHDFLEQMDSSSSTPPNSTTSFPNPTTPFFQPPFLPSDPAAATTTTPTSFPIPSTDDNFLLDSPYLRRLIQHLMTTSTLANPRPTDDNLPCYNSPASKSAIESLDCFMVDLGFLQKDPTITCPVCKDQFFLDSEAKMLPCKHLYHKECIVPWLEINSSCPVCRYRLQNHDEIEVDDEEGAEDFLGPPQLDELLDDDENFFEFRNTLRNAMRRHQFNSINSHENGVGGSWSERGEVADDLMFSTVNNAESGRGGTGNRIERPDIVDLVSGSPVEGGRGNVEIGVVESISDRVYDDVHTMKS